MTPAPPLPEFSRPERLDAIGEVPRALDISAMADERAALARRFDLVAIDSLDAHLMVRRDTIGIRVEGRVVATLVQTCSVTDDPIAVRIDEPVALHFVAAALADEELELDEGALDTIEIAGNAVDLGEMAAETMALALDPFPRGPRAAAALRAAGVLSEEEARPAGPFAGLRERLAKPQD